MSDFMSTKAIKLKLTGFVKTKAIGKEVRDKRNISEIVIHQNLKEALDGFSEFSHLFVIFWMHEISKEDRGMMKVSAPTIHVCT